MKSYRLLNGVGHALTTGLLRFRSMKSVRFHHYHHQYIYYQVAASSVIIFVIYYKFLFKITALRRSAKSTIINPCCRPRFLPGLTAYIS
jgi:hypothetical protein